MECNDFYRCGTLLFVKTEVIVLEVFERPRFLSCDFDSLDTPSPKTCPVIVCLKHPEKQLMLSAILHTASQHTTYFVDDTRGVECLSGCGGYVVSFPANHGSAVITVAMGGQFPEA